METDRKFCEGPSVVIDHGRAISGETLNCSIYIHVGEFFIKDGDNIKRGMPIAKLPEKISFCMARVRHLHLQIGQEYCEKHEKIPGDVISILKISSSLNHLF